MKSSLFISFIIAYSSGGFVLGFITATETSGISDRIVIGLIINVLSVFSLGFPPENEGGVGAPLNAWPYILLIFLIIFAIQIAFNLYKEKKSILE